MLGRIASCLVRFTLYNVHSVSSNAVAEAISDAVSMSSSEKQVGYWLGRPLFEKTLAISVPAYTTANVDVNVSTGVTGIVSVVSFDGVYIKGSYSHPNWVMKVPYTFLEVSTNKWLNIYIYWVPSSNRFDISLGGTYTNGYFSSGEIYLTFRYIKQAQPVS